MSGYNKIIHHMDKVDRLEAGKIVNPVSVEIDTTNACQNSCRYCLSKKRKPAEMDWGFYVDLIRQLSKAGVKSIVFVGGGEPTLHPAFNDMVKAAHTAGLKLGLITNGILLNAVPVELFEYIRVGLDAGNSETYREIKGTDYFDKVVANVRKVRPRCKTLGLNYVVDNQGAGDILKAEKLAHELGVDYIHFKPALEIDSGIQGRSSGWPPSLAYPRSFYTRWSEPHKKGCMMAALSGTVTADGRYAYCCLHRYDDGFTVANLHKEKLQDAIIRRASMNVDISSCPACRYYGYYEAYLEWKQPEQIYAHHAEFL